MVRKGNFFVVAVLGGDKIEFGTYQVIDGDEYQVYTELVKASVCKILLESSGEYEIGEIYLEGLVAKYLRSMNKFKARLCCTSLDDEYLHLHREITGNMVSVYYGGISKLVAEKAKESEDGLNDRTNLCVYSGQLFATMSQSDGNGITYEMVQSVNNLAGTYVLRLVDEEFLDKYFGSLNLVGQVKQSLQEQQEAYFEL